MTLTATKRFMNVSAVTFTPSGGTAISITECQGVRRNPGATILGASGDGDVYDSAKAVSAQDPSYTVTSQDIGALMQITPGMVGSFTWTMNDFLNAASTGAVVYTITHAIAGNNPSNVQHRQVADGTLEIGAWAPDGLANPESFTITS